MTAEQNMLTCGYNVGAGAQYYDIRNEFELKADIKFGYDRLFVLIVLHSSICFIYRSIEYGIDEHKRRSVSTESNRRIKPPSSLLPYNRSNPDITTAKRDKLDVVTICDDNSTNAASIAARRTIAYR